ncbi:MAG: hypothetical protein AO396_07065 [Candidatus Fermentibacter daniensis]|jgi:DNA repair protein RadC|nr:MAG: hypothetical protein AO396_07065 [Candidatus Fermentibacter daniensis]
MSVSVETQKRLIVAEKSVYYRQIRRHSIPIPVEPVDTVEKAKILLGRLLDPKPVEGLYAIALNSSGDFLGLIRVAEGTVDRASVYPRELVSFLLIETNATSLILAHSHPGGKAEASHEDKVLTTKLKGILQDLGVKLIDHFIYACGRPGITPEWVSMRERGDL